jgi:hypothetical protein
LFAGLYPAEFGCNLLVADSYASFDFFAVLQTNQMELKESEIIQLVNHIGDQEKHFNGLETQYRLLASTWLLASLGAIGYLLKDDKSSWLDSNKLYLIGAIGFVGSLGILLLWLLDIKVYHKLLHSVFIQGVLLEIKYSWLPKIRTDMLLSQETGDLTRNTKLYYICSTVFLQLISLLSFVSACTNIVNRVATLVIGLLIISLVVFYMRKSDFGSRSKKLYSKLKETYKDDIDFVMPDT